MVNLFCIARDEQYTEKQQDTTTKSHSPSKVKPKMCGRFSSTSTRRSLPIKSDVSMWSVLASPQYRRPPCKSTARPLGQPRLESTRTRRSVPSRLARSIFGFLPQSDQYMYLWTGEVHVSVNREVLLSVKRGSTCTVKREGHTTVKRGSTCTVKREGPTTVKRGSTCTVKREGPTTVKRGSKTRVLDVKIFHLYQFQVWRKKKCLQMMILRRIYWRQRHQTKTVKYLWPSYLTSSSKILQLYHSTGQKHTFSRYTYVNGNFKKDFAGANSWVNNFWKFMCVHFCLCTPWSPLLVRYGATEMTAYHFNAKPQDCTVGI